MSVEGNAIAYKREPFILFSEIKGLTVQKIHMAQDFTRAQQRPSAEPKLTELFACFSRSFPKGPSTCCHSGAWAINKSPARPSALLILKGHKDFGAQPTCLEQKVNIE